MVAYVKSGSEMCVRLPLIGMEIAALHNISKLLLKLFIDVVGKPPHGAVMISLFSQTLPKSTFQDMSHLINDKKTPYSKLFQNIIGYAVVGGVGTVLLNKYVGAPSATYGTALSYVGHIGLGNWKIADWTASFFTKKV